MKHQNYQRFAFIRRCGLTVLSVFVLASLSSSAAQAQTAPVKLGSLTTSIYTAFLPLQVFLASIAFCLGLWYVFKGVVSMRATGEGGQNAPPMQSSLFKLGGGAALISLPFVINVILNTVTADSAGTVAESTALIGDTTRKFNDAGLDHALGRFVTDFFIPFMGSAFPYFCYLAGMILMFRGIQRLANGDGKGPTAPGGLGTFTIFGVAALLMSLGYFMKLLQGSIFGVTDLYANVTLMNRTSALNQRAENVLWAIFQFLRIVGYISVVRGLFMLKAYADGSQQASLMGASTHIISGAMLANVWYFIWAVQNTFVVDQNYFVFAPPS